MTILEIQEEVRGFQKVLTEGIDKLVDSKITLDVVDVSQERYKKLREELLAVSSKYGALMEHLQAILSIK